MSRPSLTDAVQRSLAQCQAQQPWDLIVIGGGITGAGILREGARRGWRCLLLERGDFASGTSNFSSKMVHGGLRYLAQGQWRLTREAAASREQLRQRWPDLITPLPYLFLHRSSDPTPAWAMGLALKLYHYFAQAPALHRPRRLDLASLSKLQPGFSFSAFESAHHYFDAVADDAALVLRTLEEAVQYGAALRHYSPVTELIRDGEQITGVVCQDQTLHARMVINAAGVWADGLHPLPENRVIRPLRGSHLMFHQRDLPLNAALTLYHPEDRRVVFCYPWAGASVLGTTDLDHLADKAQPTQISEEEQRYLLKVLPLLGITKTPPLLASWSGLRPILANSDDNQAPSDASREHLLWQQPGLISITGGKLTTFVAMAEEALALAQQQGLLPTRTAQADQPLQGLPRWDGSLIGDSLVHRHELAYWARHGAIEQLSDLLLRRTRLGWSLGQSLRDYQQEIEQLCNDALGWSQPQWQLQWQQYWQEFERWHGPGHG
ncbi:glycerol-3-phosphate dehydrogenase/oxidase [Ferrimonas marina]|uniref:Glycerol-3-phosphate dehydrogenase n=1 Tax=Ferrimonas marina TaxID=299255 RepID=A0A1M5YV81_9GAMM|nr:glycerol-3-phosphate dehydrogenase/oxidase [Ferrimonas marina]SHI15750.1 glycerol-3-phosphate dehydrogenase [Ferrimonas marina]